jgi:hypothetical protein
MSTPAGDTVHIRLTQEQMRGTPAFRESSGWFKIRVKSSLLERARQLLFAWQIVSDDFEGFQGRWPQNLWAANETVEFLKREQQKIPSSFSTEDLVSDFVAYFAAVNFTTAEKVLTNNFAGRLGTKENRRQEKELSHLVWDQYLRLSPNSAPADWRPLYADVHRMADDGFGVAKDYREDFGEPTWPSEFDKYWPDSEQVWIKDVDRQGLLP